MRHIWISIGLLFIHVFIIQVKSNGQNSGLIPKDVEQERNNSYSKQLEHYLTGILVNEYEDRSKKLWDRDYSGADAYSRSVEPNRRRLENILNPPKLHKTGELKRSRHPFIKDMDAEWIELPLGNLTAEAIIVFPEGASKEKKVPLIIVQHGLDGFPETNFGGIVRGYNAYARELVKAGFAILAPMNLWVEQHRNHIERLCRLAGMSLAGIELSRTRHLLDIILEDPRIDRDKVGMWGISLGGQATMFAMSLDPRIKAGVVSAWFNQRTKKMVVPDERYSSFITTTEEHAFLNSWLTEFSDDDVISLICPRPVLIQHGKKDRIGYWPFIEEEFKEARVHYEKLGISDQVQIQFHEGYHEAIVESGVRFLSKSLNQDQKE